MRKTLSVVGLLTVMIFFQSKNFTACKIKDEKEETIFFFDVVESTEYYLSIYKKKAFQDLVKLSCNTQEYFLCY